MTGLELASATAAKTALSKLIGSLYAVSKDRVAKKLAQWRNAEAIRTVAAKYRQVRLVKTIWQIEKELDLLQFYSAPRVEIKKQRIELKDLDDLKYDGNLVIQGTVGQGKSILFRYLTSRELLKGRYLPLFVELRRLREEESLIEHLIAQLAALGLDSDENTFRFLCDQGKLLIFLDAFDEVIESRRDGLVGEIEHLLQRHDKLRVVVSTRPNSGIETSGFFRVYHLSPLRNGEYKQVLTKMVQDQQLARTMIEGVEAGRATVRHLLNTPLMIALLVFRFNVDQSIPENTVSFYGNLFDLLVRRHDRSKAGYQRPRRSGLGDGALHDFFCALAYITRRAGTATLTLSQLQHHARDAMTMLAFGADASTALNDVMNITCLIIEEGGECHFLHRSVQEFHTAMFIKTRPDIIAQSFYEAMLTHWLAWQGELRFLEDVDRYRFLKYFAIPEGRRALRLRDDADIERSEVTPEVMGQVFGDIELDLQIAKTGSSFLSRVGFHNLPWSAQRVFDVRLFRGLSRFDAKRVAGLMETGEISGVQRPRSRDVEADIEIRIRPLLDHPETRDVATEALRPWADEMIGYLSKSEEAVRNLEKSEIMFRF